MSTMRSLVGLTCVLLLGGCSSSGTTSAEDATRSAYIVKAEAVCARANTALTAVHAPKTNTEIPAYVHQVATLAAGTIRELDLLTPPAKDAAQLHARFLDPLLKQSDAGIRFDLEVKAAGSDQRTLLALLAKAPTKTVADLAYLRSYGFHQCVKAADTGH